MKKKEYNLSDSDWILLRELQKIGRKFYKSLVVYNLVSEPTESHDMAKYISKNWDYGDYCRILEILKKVEARRLLNLDE